MIQWNTQASKITTNSNVKIDFTSPELSVMKIVTWNWHMDDSAKGRYNIILGRDILTQLGLNKKNYNHVIEGDDGPFDVYTAPMIDLGTYEFKDIETIKIIPEE